jgi:periplasmic divalent cation tolerance protein
MEPVLLLSTAASLGDATRLARLLVEERLAACVNVVDGVRSIYRWRGAIQEDAEALLLIKTSAQRYEALARRLLEEHPYDTPELIRLDLAGGDSRYLSWLAGEVAIHEAAEEAGAGD